MDRRPRKRSRLTWDVPQAPKRSFCTTPQGFSKRDLLFWMISAWTTKPYRSLRNTLSTINRLFTFTRSHSNHAVPPPLFHEEFKQRRLQLLLQACSSDRSLDAAKSLHALTITMSSDQPIFVDNNLVTIYGSLGELSIAWKLFEKMPERNAVSYNSIIAAYTRHGNGEKAWKLFSEMMGLGFTPTQFTFGSLLSSSSLDIYQGFQLQSLIIKTGLIYADAFAGTALLGHFGRLGSLDEAFRVFEEMPRRNLVTWNSVISAFGQHGFVEESMFLFRELMRTEIHPSEYSFVGVLSGFGWVADLEIGEQIHGLVIKSGVDFYISVANSLLNVHVKCSGAYEAEKMFEELPARDVVSWNIIIGALARSEKPNNSFELFLEMSAEGLYPSQTTFVSVISSCTSLQIPKYGKFIHAKAIKNNFESDVFVGSALVDFYVKCNNFEEAHLCFDEIHEKNVVSWNALISGYSNKCSSNSVYLLREMLHLGYQPNEFSFSAVLKSSLVLELQQLHGLIIRMGYHQNEYVLSSLIALYAINGLISDALIFATASASPLPVVPSNTIAGIYNRTGQYQETQKLLSQLEEPDIVSWNILISACAHNGGYREGFELFRHMQMAQILLDNYTFVSLLSMCTKLCNLALGSAVHVLIIKTDILCCDIFICNVLVDMYGKCGSLESSVKVFNEMTHRNLISWTTLISSLGLHGYAHEALNRFREMELLGFKPDGVAFIAVLSACRHGRLVEEGMELFGRMKGCYGVEPEMSHYVCVVDLQIRYGHLKEAEQLIVSMPFQPNAHIWRTFLEGYKRYGYRGEQTVRQENVVEIEPMSSSFKNCMG